MFTVLYTDDEPTLLEMGQIFLEKSGSCSVVTALSAQAALEMLKTRPFDCIVSDYQMPDMDGIAFLKALRINGNPIPFILFTGRGREEVVIEALNNGADYYLQKGGAPMAQFAELTHKIRLAVERSRTTKALQESQERLRSFMDSATDAFTIWDAGFNLIELNRTAFSYLPPGTKKEDILGKNYAEFMPGSRERGEYSKYLDVMRTGIPFTGTAMMPDPQYGRHWLNVRCFRVGDGLGIVTTDVTREKEAEDELRAAYEQITAADEELRGQYGELARGERELRESQERLRTFMDSATDGFSIWDAGLNLVDLNQAALSLLPPGTRKEGVIGMNLRESISGSGEWGAYERYLEVVRTGLPFSGTRVWIDPEHGRHWLNIRCFRVADGLGIVTSDITKEKEAEEELRESERKFRHILENMQDAYIRVDKSGMITMVNPSAARMYGYHSAEEMTGLPIASLYHGHADRNESLQVLQESGGLTNFMGVTVRRDGTTFPVSINVQVITDEEGRVKGTEAIVRDMSERG
jgi:PAS domain S-box-containing protein